MNRHRFFTLFLLGALLAGGATVIDSQAPTVSIPADPMVGAWTLNLAKSKYSIPPPKNATVTITAAARGYTFTIEGIAASGQPEKWSYTSAFDGSESPVTGHPLIDAVIASSTGNGATVRYKRAGVVITTTTSTVSDDGRTLFVTMNVPDGKGGEITSVAVYERQ